MKIENQISELLKEQDCVIVAGLGGFIANYVPAEINPVTHVFTPPSRKVAFNAALRNNDGILANHLVRTFGIGYAEAVSQIEKQSVAWAIMLNQGEKVIIESIGHLYTDKEHHIQFVPEKTVNLMDDAFGLASFSTQPVSGQERLQKPYYKALRTNAVKSGRKLPSSLKWAAILLPLAALSFWSAYNTGQVKTIYQNQASVMPAPAQASNEATADPFAVTERLPEIPAEELLVTDTKIEVELSELTEAKTEPDHYFIITGAFGVKENAENLLESLLAKGYKATIAGQNRNGLYRVSIAGFADKEIALQKTEEFRRGEFPGAWLFSTR